MPQPELLTPPDNGVTVRMYRQGHGDCFLLAFPREGGGEPVLRADRLRLQAGLAGVSRPRQVDRATWSSTSTRPPAGTSIW